MSPSFACHVHIPMLAVSCTEKWISIVTVMLYGSASFVDGCGSWLKNWIPTTSREPAPTQNYTRINIGDVGFIRRGQFHLLFSAGSPLGERQLGDDVPFEFEELNVGTPVSSEPRRPGCLHTPAVRWVGTGLDVTGFTTLYVPSLGPSSTGLTQPDTQALGNWRKFLIRTHWRSWSGTGYEVPDLL